MNAKGYLQIAPTLSRIVLDLDINFYAINNPSNFLM